MPVVPTKDTINANVTALSIPRLQNTQSMGEARIAGQQLEGFGRAMERGGQAMGEIALDMQREANALRVDDAINQAREEAIRLQHDKDAGYTNLRGVDALNRPGGKPLADEYGGYLENKINDIAKGLGNDAQRQAFSRAGADLITGFKNSALQHEGEQFREYAKSVREGTIKNRIQNISLNYNRPDIIADDLVHVQASARDLARQLGKSAEWAEAAVREQVSKAHRVVLETALNKEDVQYADDYFKKYSKQMEPDDIVWANATLGGELDKHLAVTTAGKVIERQITNIITPDSERAFNIALGIESGGKQFGGPGSVAGADQPTTSPAGAIGIAQVMPATGPEAAKLAGVEWDENKFRTDAEYNRKLGKAYFDQQLKDFGSLAKAYAAYNAGPGALKEAMQKAESEGKPENWVSYLPEETQNYVAKNMKAYEAGRGSNEIPSLYALQQEVRKEIGDDKPKRLKMALDQLDLQYKQITEAKKAEEEKMTADAMRGLLENGGDFANLPMNVRSNIPVGDVTKVMDFAKKIANGDDTTNLALYNHFTENPQKLANLTDDQFFALRSELSETDFKYFSQERAKILNGEQPEGTNPGSLNKEAVNAAVNNNLRVMGVNPSPSFEKDEEGSRKVGAVRKFVNQAVLAQQNATGKKMSDAEVEQFVGKLFMQQATVNGTWGDGLWGSRVQGRALGMTINDIPEPTREAYKTAFASRGVNASDEDILNAYWGQLFRNSKGTF